MCCLYGSPFGKQFGNVFGSLFGWSKKSDSAGPNLKVPQTISSLEAFYDPSDTSILFQDTAGTIPVTTDGDTIRLMKDKSPNGRDVVVDGVAPHVYRTDGTYHWIEFSGSNSPMQTVSTANIPVAYAGGAIRPTHEADVLWAIFSAKADVTTTGVEVVIGKLFGNINEITNLVSFNNIAGVSVTVNGEATKNFAPQEDSYLVQNDTDTSKDSFIDSGLAIGTDRNISGRNFQGRFYGGVLYSTQPTAEEKAELDQYFADTMPPPIS